MGGKSTPCMIPSSSENIYRESNKQAPIVLPLLWGLLYEVRTMETVKFGTSSITVRCEVRTKFSKRTIVTIEKIVFVHVDKNGRPKAHGITQAVE